MNTWITDLFNGKGNEKKASMPEERQMESDNWAEGLSEDADAVEKMSAATAGTIFQQFVDDLGDEKRTAFNLSHLEHALSYAPGMDMIDPDHWTQLMDIAKNQDVFRFTEIVQDFARQYADQKGTTYEKHMKEKYPVDEKDASKKEAAYEVGDNSEKTIEKDYKLRVSGLSDWNLAEMLAERIQAEKGTATVNTNEELDKQLKSVKSGREAAEKKLLSLIGDHTSIDWKKAFQKFEDAKPVQAKEDDLYGDEVAKKKWDKKETFTEKSDKEKIKDMEGVGKEEEKGQVGKEASKKKADVPVEPVPAQPETKLMAIYNVFKEVTKFNEDSQDWSGERSSHGIIDKGNMEVSSVEEVLEKVQNDLGLDEKLEAFEDEPGRYDINRTEDGDSNPDPNGKYLADYSVYVKLYKEASKTPKVKKKASEVTDKIKKKVEKKINEIVDQALDDAPQMPEVPPVDGMPPIEAPIEAPIVEELPIVEIKKQDDKPEESKEEEVTSEKADTKDGKCARCGTASGGTEFCETCKKHFKETKKDASKKKADELTDTVVKIKDNVETTKERLDVQTKESDGDNYETEALYIWLNNDEELYNDMQTLKQQYPSPQKLVTPLKDYIEEKVPDLGTTVWSDLLNGAVSDVDWLGLANSMFDVGEGEPEPEVDVPPVEEPVASKKETKEIKSKLTKKEITAKFKTKADIDSPWKVIKDKNGEEVVARIVSPLKREKLSKDKKKQDKKSN